MTITWTHLKQMRVDVNRRELLRTRLRRTEASIGTSVTRLFQIQATHVMLLSLILTVLNGGFSALCDNISYKTVQLALVTGIAWVLFGYVSMRLLKDLKIFEVDLTVYKDYINSRDFEMMWLQNRQRDVWMNKLHCILLGFLCLFLGVIAVLAPSTLCQDSVP